MKTILYNSATDKIIGTYPNGYTVDGKPQPVYPPINRSGIETNINNFYSIY